MMLPRWIWRVLRHPRFRAAVLWGIPVLLVVVALGFALANLAGRQRHADLLRKLEARGVAVTEDDAFGPEVPREQNLYAHTALEALRKEMGKPGARHPRLSGFVGIGARTLGDMPSWQPPTFNGPPGTRFKWTNHGAPDSIHRNSSPPDAEKLAHLIAEWPELDGVVEALRRPSAVRRARRHSGEQDLGFLPLNAITTLGLRGRLFARLGNSSKAADDANALLEGARTLLHADLPLNKKIGARAAVSSAAKIIQQGSWLGAWTAEQLAGFEWRLVAIEPHAAMISGLRCSLSLAATTGVEGKPRIYTSPGSSFYDSVVSAWRALDHTPDATWPDRAEAVWYYHRPDGFWLGDLARRCETVDAWTKDRKRFSAEDWKLLRPHYAEAGLGVAGGFQPDKALPLAHVALAAAHALDLETELAFARLAVELDRERIKNGRYMESPFWAHPALAEKLLTDPWSGGKLKRINSRVPGEEVEFRSVGPDGVASLQVSPWGDFTDEGDRSWHCGYDRTPRPLPKFPVTPGDPNR